MIKNICGLEIEITYKKVKNINLRVKVPDGKVTVSAPYRTSEEYIYNFVKSKIDWINYQRERILSLPKDSDNNVQSGDKVRIFNKEYTLKIIADNKKDDFYFENDCVFLCLKGSYTELKAQQTLDKYLKIILQQKLNEYLDKWQHITRLYSTGYSVKKMRTRWGSCNVKTYKLNFNLALVHQSYIAIEYVVLHEIIHIKVPDHSKNFKDLLTFYMPDWKERKKILNINI